MGHPNWVKSFGITPTWSHQPKLHTILPLSSKPPLVFPLKFPPHLFFLSLSHLLKVRRKNGRRNCILTHAP